MVVKLCAETEGLAFLRPLMMTSLRSYLIRIILMLVVFSIAVSASNGFVHKCIDSKHHKSSPGPEGRDFVGSCKPWSNYSCCTTNTSAKIHADGILSLYNMVLDQCPSVKNMSDKCRKHFKRDTCFYECSPNLSPWVVTDKVSKKTRKERAMHIPLCSDDCDQWFHDCEDDYTCSGNWGNITGWNWKKKGTPAMCTQPCRTFFDYFRNPKTFCEKIFNYSYKYGSSNKSECMQLWPKSWKDNLEVAKLFAKRKQIKDFATSLRPIRVELILFPLFASIFF